MQDGTNDSDNEYDNWWLVNPEMEAAPKYKCYDLKFIKGSGTHSSKHEETFYPNL